MIERNWTKPIWDERVRRVADEIPPGSRVLDLGAGAQTLKGMLPARCGYTPADLESHFPNTVLFDMNKQKWPKGYWDIAVLSGVLEFADHPGEVLAHLHHITRTALVTYDHSMSLKSRRESKFKNHLSRAGLELLFEKTGWRYQPIATWKQQTLYRIAKARRPL